MRDRSPSIRAVPHSGRPARSLFKEKRETGRLPQPTGGARNSRYKALGLALRQAEVIAEILKILKTAELKARRRVGLANH